MIHVFMHRIRLKAIEINQFFVIHRLCFDKQLVPNRFSKFISLDDACLIGHHLYENLS